MNVFCEVQQSNIKPGKRKEERPLHLLILSAKTEIELQELRAKYISYLESTTDEKLADICFTANISCKCLKYRLAVIASSVAQMREKLMAPDSESMGVVENQENKSKIAFLFTSQGYQYVGMGRQLYQTQPTFRQALDRCNNILSPYLEKPLLEILYPPEEIEESTQYLLDETAYTQPALFAVQYAMFELWKSWGIKPDVMMGYSVGEYAAACVAGVFSLENVLKVIAERSRLMAELPKDGKIVAVKASEQEVRTIIGSQPCPIWISAINGPKNVAIAGKIEDVGAVSTAVEAQGLEIKKLNASVAFHSPLMKPMLGEFKQALREISFSPPQIKLVSSMTGKVVIKEVTSPDYWCRQIIEPVEFLAGMNSLKREGIEIFVEIGPKPTLLRRGCQCLPDAEYLWLPSLSPTEIDWQQMLTSTAALYLRGIPVDWVGFDRDYNRSFLPIPSYHSN
ncbi:MULTISPECIES: acyltransferase domain-containing protein [Okeania]|uniref:Acyltransferase domain-containing protein n=3 Tax=Okeania TaxID=1458928 RepID=A0A3N6RD25_9CYAN|nr:MULTISPECIES: acyltransferase domain-containing protein [Okeania]NET13347.1 acyltransferase domain-containing protein [Okeania sp. SIO1H6]NEP71469.1 acyltransferase domain-containing protein [Okeania sp. SIO2G5]NEP92217.1 acyltransferase domain-containing protein [Okeania sp. SIO2F5]NEQ89671.1 acyltransferase domain-containing protein [Okeania sp. SIO2G4]NES76141.1 acyltransferase domain-containing protein [Okeania sp. SIO1H4]